MRSFIITVLLLVSISAVYLGVNSTIAGALGDSASFSPVLTVVNTVSVAMTPPILYFFLVLTGYMMVQVFTDTGGIRPLLGDMWMAFLPILMSAVFSWWVLQEMSTYDLRNVDDEEVQHIQLGFGLTLPQLSIISNLAYVALYAIFTYILVTRFSLRVWQAGVAAVMPSAMVWAVRVVIGT